MSNFFLMWEALTITTKLKSEISYTCTVNWIGTLKIGCTSYYKHHVVLGNFCAVKKRVNLAFVLGGIKAIHPTRTCELYTVCTVGMCFFFGLYCRLIKNMQPCVYQTITSSRLERGGALFRGEGRYLLCTSWHDITLN